MADDLTYLNKTELTRYHTKVDTKMKTKVDRSVKDDQNAINTIDNQKAQEGCVMSTAFPSTDTTGTVVSFNTASENGPDGILAQVYAKNTTGADAGKGMRLNFKKTGAYYGVGASTPTDAAHELAVKGDINKAYEIELDLDDGHWKKSFDAAVVGESLDVIWNNIKTGKAMVKATFDDNGFAYTAEMFGFMVFGGQAYIDIVALENPGTTDEVVKNYHAQIEYVSKGGDVSLTVSVYKASDLVEFISADFTHDTSVSPVTEWTGTIGNTESDPSLPKKMWSGLCNGKLLPKITTDGFGVIIGDPDQKYDFNFTGLTVNRDPADPDDMYQAVLQGEMIGRKLNAAGDEETAKFRLDLWYEADDTIPEYKIMGKITILPGSVEAVDIEVKAEYGIEYPMALIDQDTIDKIFDELPPLNVLIVDKDGKEIHAAASDYVKDDDEGRITVSMKTIDNIVGSQYEFEMSSYAMMLLKTPLPIPELGTSINAVLEKIEGVYNGLDSTSTLKSLSAFMGNLLNQRLDAINYGRNLGKWSCLSGLPESPVILSVGFSYKYLDYFVVGTISGDPDKNLIPDSMSYTAAPSTTYETKPPSLGDYYVYTGKDGKWEKKSPYEIFVDYKNLAGEPSTNPKLMAEFDKKLNKDNTATGSIGTSWTASGDLYVNILSWTGMTSSEQPIVSVIYNKTTKAEMEAQIAEAAKIVRIETDTNRLVVYAKEPTTQELDIQVKRV